MGKEKKTTFGSYQIRLTSSAEKDRDEIIDYIAFVNEQPINAVGVGDALEQVFINIQLNPFAYKECESLPTKTKMYRQAVCLSWLIVYKIVGMELIVLGIVHGARKPSTIKRLKRI